MPDPTVVASDVRQRVAELDRRRAELERELVQLDRDHRLLLPVLALIEQYCPDAGPPDVSPGSDPPPLIHRILDALLSSSARTRADVVKLFASEGIKEATVDSALSRLKKNGAVEKRRGGVLVVVADPRLQDVPDPGTASDPAAAPARYAAS